jgi:hypothetical protein
MVGAAAFEVLVVAAVATAEEAEGAVALAEEELEDVGAVYLAGSSVPQFAFSASLHALWAAALLALFAMHSM